MISTIGHGQSRCADDVLIMLKYEREPTTYHTRMCLFVGSRQCARYLTCDYQLNCRKVYKKSLCDFVEGSCDYVTAEKETPAMDSRSPGESLLFPVLFS